MGSLLSFLSLRALCCSGGAAISMVKEVFSKATTKEVNRYPMGSFGYLALFIFNSILAWMMASRYFQEDINDLISWKLKCINYQCFGAMAVFRVCFGLVLFHLLMFLCSLCITKPWLQLKMWGWKILVYLIFVVVAVFIPQSFYIDTMSGWFIGASIFLLFQLTLFVEFAYDLASALINKMNSNSEEGKFYIWLAVIYCAILGAFILGVTIAFWVYYGTRSEYAESCSWNGALVSVNFVSILLICSLSISEYVTHSLVCSGLIQSITIGAYSTYLVANAITSQPDTSCNPFAVGGKFTTLATIVAALFTFAITGYSAFKVLQRDSQNLQNNDDKELKSVLETGKESDVDDDPSDDVTPGLKVPENPINEKNIAGGYRLYHLSLAAAMMYIAMLITNWTMNSGEISHVVKVGYGWASAWVKVISAVLTLILYIWTLFAPRIFPDREFTF